MSTSGTANLSGNAYVAVRQRRPEDDDNRRPSRVPLVAERNCDHVSTICATTSCVESWEIDWELLFRRTAGGRRLAAVIGRDLNDA